jgi:SAM-dependent methyltransferase
MTTPQPTGEAAHEGQLTFDEGIAERFDARYRTRDIVHRRELVYRPLDVKPGDRILDVGCGPGFVVAELLGQVGPQDQSSEWTAAPRCSRLRHTGARATATSPCTRRTQRPYQ